MEVVVSKKCIYTLANVANIHIMFPYCMLLAAHQY